jgi:hypothetical protein
MALAFAPAAINNFQSISINVGAHDWSTDITDGFLTLGIRNTVTPPAGGFSYTQSSTNLRTAMGVRPPGGAARPRQARMLRSVARR